MRKRIHYRHDCPEITWDPPGRLDRAPKSRHQCRGFLYPDLPGSQICTQCLWTRRSNSQEWLRKKDIKFCHSSKSKMETFKWSFIRKFDSEWSTWTESRHLVLLARVVLDTAWDIGPGPIILPFYIITLTLQISNHINLAFTQLICWCKLWSEISIMHFGLICMMMHKTQILKVSQSPQSVTA